MKIANFYSHLNGYEYLLVHKKHIWDEIEETINKVDAEKYMTKISKEKTMKGKRLYSPVELNKEYSRLFSEHNWTENRTYYWVTDDEKIIRKTMFMSLSEQKVYIESKGKTPLQTYNQTDFFKDRVAIEVQLGKYAFVAFDLFVKHMAFYVGDAIDVGIEIVPTKKMEKEMSSGVPYYERDLYNLIRQGRGIPAVPIVLIGIEPD